MTLNTIGGNEHKAAKAAEAPVVPVKPTAAARTPRAKRTQDPDKALEPIAKRLGIIAAVVGLLISVGGAVNSFSSHLAVVDEKLAAGAQGTVTLNIKYDNLDKRVGNNEKAEHDHFERLIGPVTATQTDVKWIMRAMGKK